MNRKKPDLEPDLFSAKSQRIYLDHNATAPISQLVVEKIPEIIEAWGNPSSIHQFGRKPKNILRNARQAVADLLGCHSLEVIFTSGGTETNNLVFRSEFENQRFLHKKQKIHWLVSAVEHPSIASNLDFFRSKGVEIDLIAVNRDGSIDLDNYANLFKPYTSFVSCMLANNETGSVFPVKKMAKIAHEKGAKFHSDCVQATGKILFNVNDLDVDYATISAHKFYALKGTGALFSRSGNHIEPIIAGGGQERGRRGGTENIVGIASLGIMADQKNHIPSFIEHCQSLRDYMEKEILENIEGVQINALPSRRVCNTSSMLIDGIDGETLLMNLDLKGVGVSTGAACSSGNPEPSPVLLAMGLSRAEAQSSLRLSLGWGTKQEEVDQFLQILNDTVKRLRKIRNEL